MSDNRKSRPDRQKGSVCVPETIPPIPDTFENVIKALVQPVRKGTRGRGAV